ncbi:hypothetical protein HAX54_047135 [Datura stramonium]|uniref:Uncharacterized protein n=1 Tax=Datura stramonium TaxID=4076 RepID=A0ABS8WLM2_DATST|nr:hypothetical protein [Datura stramonium]
MTTQKAMKDEDVPSLPNNADDEDIEGRVEEEILKETFEGILLNGEVLEEVDWMKKELKQKRGIGGARPAKCRVRHESGFKALGHCLFALHLHFTG